MSLDRNNQGTWRRGCNLMIAPLGGPPHRWEVWVTTKGPQMPRRPAFFSMSLPHKVGPQSLVVDLEVASKGSQAFPRSKSTTWKLPGDPSHLGFPTNQE
jgi:hypothetical protein